MPAGDGKGADRRLRARLSRTQNVVGYVAVPGPADSETGCILYIAAFFEDALFCRTQRAELKHDVFAGDCLPRAAGPRPAADGDLWPVEPEGLLVLLDSCTQSESECWRGLAESLFGMVACPAPINSRTMRILVIRELPRVLAAAHRCPDDTGTQHALRDGYTGRLRICQPAAVEPTNRCLV